MLLVAAMALPWGDSLRRKRAHLLGRSQWAGCWCSKNTFSKTAIDTGSSIGAIKIITKIIKQTISNLY